MKNERTDIRLQLGLRPVINVSGTMTALGASIVVPQAIRRVSEILPQFVEIHDLQRKASAVIARLTGAEAGCVTASVSAGITISVAGAMTGADLARIEQLPDTTGMKDEVVIQAGHMVQYGAPVEQAIRLAGAKVVMVGTATHAMPHQLAGITASIEPDPTNNPLDRLKLAINPNEAKITAWELADSLAAGDPPVIVRDHESEHGYFYLDPCNLHPGQAEVVADRICEELEIALQKGSEEHTDLTAMQARKFEKFMSWPD